MTRRDFLYRAAGCSLAFFNSSAFVRAGSLLRSVKEFGAVGDGESDDTEAIFRASKSGARVFFPPGFYRFTVNDAPSFPGGVVLVKGAHVVGPIFDDIFLFDPSSGVFMGVLANHLEHRAERIGDASPRWILSSPPLIERSESKIDVDIIAHWYNDFGLEATRLGKGMSGSLVWYYWTWAFKSVGASYDSRRHPFLGWYHGDDDRVLGWQCYWLVTYGVRAVNLTGVTDYSRWNSESSKDFWKYLLINKKVPNFQSLDFLLWLSTKGEVDEIVRHWERSIEIYAKCGNAYGVFIDGRYCPVFYIFEFSELLYSLSGCVDSFLLRIQSALRRWDYSGAVLLARHSKSIDSESRFLDFGLVIRAAGYSNITGASGATYPERAASAFSSCSEAEIYNIATSLESWPPHPSGWSVRGSTPELFGSVVYKALRCGGSVLGSRRVIQIYNVSEWAEGGPGLQPDRFNGFGYLEALERELHMYFLERGL